MLHQRAGAGSVAGRIGLLTLAVLASLPASGQVSPDDPAADGVETIPVRPTVEGQPPAAGTAPAEVGEIIVTAQKTPQSIRDVPISMSVLSDQFVADHGIVDIVQAMQYVPNVKIASAGFFAAPQARGFSFNNNNKAFESPLGIAFDGIPYSNTTYFNAGLFDIARVEVLRGPQGTTFGKNTTAGLVSIVTADPSSSFGGVATVQSGQFGRRHVELAVTGPLVSDVVDFRIAGIYDDNDGFVTNTTAAVDAGVPDRLRGYGHKGFRGKLKFPDLMGTDLKLQYESVDLDNSGAGIELWHTGPLFEAFNRLYDPKADFSLGNDRNSEDGPDFRNAHVDTFVAEWNIPIGKWSGVVLGGYSELKETLGVDVDFSPVPGMEGFAADRFPTSTLEVRAQSPALDGLFGLNDLFGMDLGHTRFLGGLFYQHRAIRDSYFRFNLDDTPFLGETAAAQADFEAGGPLAGGIPGGLVALPGGLVDPLAVVGKHDVFTQNFGQSGSVIALFQQTEWNFLPAWVLQAGFRISRETKHAAWDLTFDSPPPSVVLPALGLQQFSAGQSLRETQIQPKISLNYKPSDEISLFAHWTRGFKGGGFNAFAYDALEKDLVYQPETTTEWGFDIKASFLGGSLRPNLSLYRMDAHHFQVLGREKPPVVNVPGVGAACVPAPDPLGTVCLPPSVIGLGTTRVFNANLARAQGVEGDLTWLVGKGLSVFGTLGFNDTRYLDFKDNECPASNMAPTCDATGSPFAFAPRWDTSLTPSWIVGLPFGGLSLTPSFTVQYIGAEFLDTDLEKAKRQPGFVRYNASISIGDAERGWSLQLIGNNLTDKATSVRYGDVFPDVFVSVPESTREVFGQFRWAF